jgi:hypothetical protein
MAGDGAVGEAFGWKVVKMRADEEGVGGDEGA